MPAKPRRELIVLQIRATRGPRADGLTGDLKISLGACEKRHVASDGPSDPSAADYGIYGCGRKRTDSLICDRTVSRIAKEPVERPIPRELPEHGKRKLIGQ